MTDTPTVEPLTGGAAPFSWDEVRARVASAQSAWLATVHPDGRPHVRPVLSVVADGAVHTVSGPATRKSRNLVADGRASLTLRDEGLDVVVEGRAERVTDPAALAAVSQAYADKYGWPTTVVGAALDAADGAPTAGPPPYEPWVLRPTTVLAFGTDEENVPRSARFRF